MIDRYPSTLLPGSLLVGLLLGFSAIAQPPAERPSYGPHGGFAYSDLPATTPKSPSLSPEERAVAPRARWIEPAGGRWSDPANWDKGVVPDAGHHAVFDLEGTYEVVLDADTRVAGLTLGAPGATLRLVEHGLALDGAARVAAGAVLHLDGGNLTGPGDLEVAGTLYWTGGAVSGGGALRVGPAGRVVVDGARRKFLSLRRLENRGEIVWRGSGDVVLTFTGAIDNQAEGRFVIEADALLDVYGPPGPTLHNAGLLQKKSTGKTGVEPPVTNVGRLEIAAGTLDLLGGYTQTAGVTHLAGGELGGFSETDLRGGTLERVATP